MEKNTKRITSKLALNFYCQCMLISQFHREYNSAKKELAEIEALLIGKLKMPDDYKKQLTERRKLIVKSLVHYKSNLKQAQRGLSVISCDCDISITGGKEGKHKHKFISVENMPFEDKLSIMLIMTTQNL